MVSDDHGATPLLPLGELVNTSSKLSWVEEIPITSQSTLVDGAGNPSMSYSSSKHQWWGADWNLLVQYTSEYDKDALHVYVQLDKPLEFSGRVFSRSVSFCLYLLNYRSLNDYATAGFLHSFLS